MYLLTVLLFGFWVILSGKFDTFHLGIGLVSACLIALGTRRLLLLEPTIGLANTHPVDMVPWNQLLWYLPWLMGQIVLSSLQVAWVVLHPKMPIQPQLLRFNSQLPHALARVTLATSITMTPGTITLDVEGDDFLIHALTESNARALLPIQGEGIMQKYVKRLYEFHHAERRTETKADA